MTDDHKQRKQREAARKGAQTRAGMKRAREQWEQRQNAETDEDPLRDLHKAEVQYRSAQSRADLLRLERNRLIRLAIAAGWTHAQIAETTGLTRGRVGQLAE